MIFAKEAKIHAKNRNKFQFQKQKACSNEQAFCLFMMSLIISNLYVPKVDLQKALVHGISCIAPLLDHFQLQPDNVF